MGELETRVWAQGDPSGNRDLSSPLSSVPLWAHLPTQKKEPLDRPRARFRPDIYPLARQKAPVPPAIEKESM